MTLAEFTNQYGIKPVQLAYVTGESRQNLQAMLKSNPRRLELLCKGATVEINGDKK